MSELFREITQAEFEKGIDNRLSLGQFVVGEFFTIRYETYIHKPPHYMEGVVMLTETTMLANQLLASYYFELSRLSSTKTPETYSGLFNPDGMSAGSLRAYLSHESLPNWQDAMSELESLDDDRLLVSGSSSIVLQN